MEGESRGVEFVPFVPWQHIQVLIEDIGEAQGPHTEGGLGMERRILLVAGISLDEEGRDWGVMGNLLCNQPILTWF